MQHAWHMYPLGLVFGLGFDTASEVGLLAMTAGASTGNLPAPAILSLPILFAAGMSLMDTTDGVLLGAQFRLQGGVYRLLARIDFAQLGYLVVGLLLLTWGGSLFWWKVVRGEKRPASALQSCGR
jgi:high-affinity nickel permease